MPLVSLTDKEYKDAGIPLPPTDPYEREKWFTEWEDEISAAWSAKLRRERK